MPEPGVVDLLRLVELEVEVGGLHVQAHHNEVEKVPVSGPLEGHGKHCMPRPAPDLPDHGGNECSLEGPAIKPLEVSLIDVVQDVWPLPGIALEEGVCGVGAPSGGHHQSSVLS